jgi:hypothetical protein
VRCFSQFGLSIKKQPVTFFRQEDGNTIEEQQEALYPVTLVYSPVRLASPVPKCMRFRLGLHLDLD